MRTPPEKYDNPASPSPAQPGPGLARPASDTGSHMPVCSLSLTLSLSAALHIHHHLAHGSVATGNEKLERGAAARQVNTWICSLRTDGGRQAGGRQTQVKEGNTNSTF